MPTIRVFKLRFNVPANRATRAALGGGLVAGGVLGFLPVLGFWMIPAGVLVLAIDFPVVRRWNRRATIRFVRAWNGFRRKQRSSPGST